MPDTIVAYHADRAAYEARPAINVKCHRAGRVFWPTLPTTPHFPGASDAFDEAMGKHVEVAYERVQSDFWMTAEQIAEQNGLGPIEQEGRSGGWLVFTDGRDPQDPETFCDGDGIDHADDDAGTRRADHMPTVKDWLAAYRSMVEWAETWIADAPRKVRDLAQQYAMDAAGEAAALRMFAFDPKYPPLADRQGSGEWGALEG